MNWSPVHGANDVGDLAALLKKKGVRVMTLTESSATAEGIRSALRKLVAECGAGDIVYVHFSGHGQAFEDLSGDEADGWDEAIIPYDAAKSFRWGVYEGENHILDDELEKYFDSLRLKVGERGFVYVVIDACHSGGMARGEEIDEDEWFFRGTDACFSPNGRRYVPVMDKRGNIPVERKPGLSGICILEACRAYQTNTEIKENGRFVGPLSHYVGRWLNSHRLDSDPQWTESVRKMMESDPRLIKQNMVIEKTK